MVKRKVAVVTGSRAEYGLLYCLMDEIKADPLLDLQVIATGMHLSPEFGLTYRNIESDGFVIDAKVEMLLSSDTVVGITKAVGLGLIGFADVLERLKPDLMVVLGDRFEILAAVQAALIARIPVAHIHGGEATEGCIDDAIRHGVTKMSHLHFPASEEYRQRIIQMGEHPERVFNFGAPGLDNIRRMKLLSKEELEQELDFKLDTINFMVTFHPVTLDQGGPLKSLKALFEALDDFSHAKVILTLPNADTDGRVIIQEINQYARVRSERVKVFTSLGQLRYLSALKYVDVVIGNSSSGLIEVPIFRKPTVNIGDRQKGRLRAISVIDCNDDRDSIKKAIDMALSLDFRKSLSVIESPYGNGDASRRIKEIIKTVDLSSLLSKSFYDCR
ncbi:UDP-N-acetylglucosamine 2-epimerase (hydrolyzing) [Heliobacterium chlorum]|uniref:UDP-N-acetylglucosamine 2-epimerase (Hydrolyzing) n=1 Tax=Heliobacterium chlorum TaxID=2698 RepID=A0ABR7T0W7_HELCL|nr:UDP-N-acetylglucosamine 2-epimerase [Heliobacterium chlorum]MBC9784428.1 UDP-N-acetylglucosamine 2-epimerase (hydrolyzing) [Heliobacterium chlorum]